MPLFVAGQDRLPWKMVALWDKEGPEPLPMTYQALLINPLISSLSESDLKEYQSGFGGQAAGAIRAILLCAIAFGLRWTPEQIAAFMLAVEAVLTVVVRQSVTPLASPRRPSTTPTVASLPRRYSSTSTLGAPCSNRSVIAASTGAV